MNNGIFTVSLDFELYWGMRDKKSLTQYEDNLNGVSNAIKEVLNTFDVFGIHATWATVGFLFFSDIMECRNNLPALRPNYSDKTLSPYLYINNTKAFINKYHFAPDLIESIRKHENQEIGTHTFSHYYCLEEGQDKESFRMDISTALRVATKKDLEIFSLVFPRNQWSQSYLSILAEQGIKCFRGNESGWLFKNTNSKKSNNKFKRAMRLLDSYINLSGHNTHDIKTISRDFPYDIAASRFLRPFSAKLAIFENIRLRRITRAMTFAAKNKTIFHLWWHPHNFGVNTNQNILFLNKVLAHFEKLNNEYDMQSLNMGEIANLIEEKYC